MERYLKVNRTNWDARVRTHVKSRFYDVAGFLCGKTSLKPLEIKEVGPVRGKKLLHLQCHFGMDTLSWARRGAVVTGVDFSGKAIEQARSLAAEAKLPATFVQSDVLALPKVLRGKFDIVFASYGIWCWIPDLRRWLAVAAHFLKPGGVLYVAEDHPFANIFNQKGDAMEVPYFKSTACGYPPSAGYTDGGDVLPPTVEWMHTVEEILDAVRLSGLTLEFFHEFPYSPYKKFDGMKKGRDGFYRIPGKAAPLPLLFSLRAKRG